MCRRHASSGRSTVSEGRCITVKRLRLDELLVARGLAETRSQARALVLAGEVRVEGHMVDKAGYSVSPDAAVELAQPARFVSRGGEKLDHALTIFQVDVAGSVCADFGASTGGFTDVLLQRGALKVYAIDVGYGQLHYRLRADPRVVVLDRVNVRYLESLPQPVDVVTIDVSFISLSLVLPAAARVLQPSGRCAALVKPQFEAGREKVGKGGVVREQKTHREVLERAAAFAREAGFTLRGVTRSPITGPAGNVEFFILLDRAPEAGPEPEPLIRAALMAAARRD
ncbi:MAG TPA: TlyA family RNA methyltransferase [Thermomicrobiaceae bacterium]|nr:TlyA family RNA methyltransferase [Thermomicrobiaceae bacterium]